MTVPTFKLKVALKLEYNHFISRIGILALNQTFSEKRFFVIKPDLFFFFFFWTLVSVG
jgi:hypothetical protein